MAKSNAPALDGESCPVCRNAGQTSALRVFWISLHEAVKLCQDSACTYPLGVVSTNRILIQKDAVNHASFRKKIKTRRRSGLTRQKRNPLHSSLSHKLNSTLNCNPVKDLNVDSLQNDEQLSKTFEEILSELSSLDTTPTSSGCTSETSYDASTASNVSTVATDEPFDIESLFDSSLYTECSQPSSNATSETTPASVSNAACQPVVDEKVCSTPRVQDLPATPKVQLQSKSAAKKPLPSVEVLLNPPLLQSCAVPCDISNSFLQWRNVDNLCWLDVSMKLLAHSKLCSDVMTHSKNSVLHRLMLTYSQAQVMLRKGLQLNRCLDFCKRGRPVQLETSVGRVLVPTGGGSASSNWATVSISQLEEDQKPMIDSSVSVMDEKTLSHLAKREDEQARALMTDLREDMWRVLQPKLRCLRGQKDSPVFAIPLLLSEVENQLKLSYTWRMLCQRCGKSHSDSVQRIIPTLPSTPSDFSMQNPCFMRSCLHCQYPGQRMNMHVDSFPSSFFVHFVEGLHYTNVSDYDFSHGAEQYAVRGVIQFKKSPDHFVAWIRNPVENTWMECDDLKGTLCRFVPSQPSLLPSQMHLLMWERQTPGNGYVKPDVKAQKTPEMTAMKLLHKSASSVPREDRISRMKERFLKTFAPPSSTPVTASSPSVSKVKPVKKQSRFSSYVSSQATQPEKQKSVTFVDNDRQMPKTRKRKAKDYPVASPDDPPSSTSAKQAPPVQDTVFKLEISHPSFNRVITLKSPVKSSTKPRTVPSPDLDQIFQKLRDTLNEEPSLVVAPPAPALIPPPVHTKRTAGSLCPSDWMSYAAGVNAQSKK